MRYTGPRNRLARKEGIDLGLKTIGSKSHSNMLRKIKIPPGQHGSGKFKKLTDYGYQLRENQKLKRIYGLTQNQMKNYFQKASRKKGNTAENLYINIESRLDNVIYRLGFCPTRPAARQLICHGHIKVNDKKIAIPSYQIKINDKITFYNQKTSKIPYIEEFLQRKDISLSSWLERQSIIGKVKSYPSLQNMQEAIDLQSVVEFYSR